MGLGCLRSAGRRTEVGNNYGGDDGTSVVDQCLGAGLVDEILMHVVPEPVGDGVRLFRRLDVNLRLRVDKAVA
jgi:dihydrofolate reductase